MVVLSRLKGLAADPLFIEAEVNLINICLLVRNDKRALDVAFIFFLQIEDEPISKLMFFVVMIGLFRTGISGK